MRLPYRSHKKILLYIEFNSGIWLSIPVISAMNYMKQEFKMTLKLERKKRQWKILLFEIIQLSFYYIIFFWVSCLSYVCIVRRVSEKKKKLMLKYTYFKSCCSYCIFHCYIHNRISKGWVLSGLVLSNIILTNIKINENCGNESHITHNNSTCISVKAFSNKRNLSVFKEVVSHKITWKVIVYSVIALSKDLLCLFNYR